MKNDKAGGIGRAFLVLVASVAVLLSIGIPAIPSSPARAETAAAIDWTRQFNIGSETEIYVAADSSGIYVADLDSVRKYNADGDRLWSVDLDVPGGSQLLVSAISAYDGDVYLAGNYFCSAETSSGDFCGGFILKYDAGGTEIWSRYLEGEITHSSGWGVHADESGAYLIGNTVSVESWDEDGFLRKFDASGNELWFRYLGFGNGDSYWGVCAEGASVYVSGSTFEYDSEPVAYQRYLSKWDTAGNEAWTRQFNLTDFAQASPITADPGGVYIADGDSGRFRKYDTGGNEVWTRHLASDQVATARALCASGGALYVAGSVSGALAGQTSHGGNDAFISEYDAGGNQVWVRQFGSTADDSATAAAVHDSGMYVAGSTSGTMPSSQGTGNGFLSRLSNASLISIEDVQALFPEEVVSYNPLLPPDAVYLYYNVAYSADSQYWEEGDAVDTSGFSLTANGQPVQAEGCTVFKTSGQDGSYQATLQFEVPFSAQQISYNLSADGFSASTVVTAQREPIKVNDEFMTYIRVGAGLILGAKVDLGSGLLGGKLKGDASALSGGIFGRASGGFESEVSYNGDGDSEDYIVFGFPLSAEAGLEGSLVKVEAEGNVVPMGAIDATMVDAGSLSVAGYGSFISYPVKANLEDDADLISAFIIPIAANSATGSPALLLKIAGMADPLLPWDIYSPYKGIDRYGFTFSPSAEILSLDISCGVAGKTEMFSNTLSLLDISGEFNTFWEDGQENGSTVDTHTFTGEGGVAILEYDNADRPLIGFGGMTYEKTGQVGPDKYVIVTGGEPEERVLEEGELRIRQWELDADNYAKLYDENRHFSLKNLPRLYETDTIRGVTYYQPKPGTFHMDLLEVEAGIGVSGEVKIGADLEHKMRVPIGTTYASFGVVYPVSEVSPASIRGNIDKVDQYAGNSLEVLKDSLATNAEAVKGWMKEILLGLSTNVVATVNEAADQLSVVAQETGEAIAEVATQAYGAAQDFAVSVWEGRFNPDAAIDNANLEFASKVILIEQGSGQPVPDGTTATIHPNANVAPEELIDAGVYTFRDGAWKYVPSVPNQDGSYTFALTAGGYYALIHAFPVDPLPLQQSLMNMAPGSSTVLTSDVVRNADGSVAANGVFSIDLLEGATIASDGTSISFGESPITFPESATTDSNGRLSIPIDAGALEGESCLAVRSASGYSSQVARVVVSNGAGIDNNFTVAIKMVQPAEGMAQAGQPVTLQALTTYASSDIRWVIVDQFGNKEHQAGESMAFTPSHSGIYEVYCFAKDANGYAHLAYAQVPVTDPSHDTDADGMSDDIEDVYGADPQTPDTEVLLGGLEENRAPVADAGSSYAGSAQSAVAFSALASYDPDYDPLEYHWDFGDGTTGTGISPAHTFANRGEYVVTVTVTDDAGLTDAATAPVTVGYPRCDINQSGKVDYKDLAMLGAAYGTAAGAPGFNANADINQDGVVNYKDLAMLGAHYGEAY